MYTLILFISISIISDKDSMTMTNVQFSSEVLCKNAGLAAVKEFDKGTKQVKFICVKN